MAKSVITYLSTHGLFLGVSNCPSYGPVAAGRELPHPKDHSECQEHLETYEDVFYSNCKVRLTFNTCLQLFSTGNIIG